MIQMISVIIIAYNRKKYLKNAVESILRQSLKNDIEVIVIKNFKDKDIDQFLYDNNVLNIFNNEKTWIGANYSLGIKEAKGDIITFLDDDDYYDEYRLKRINETFHKHRDLCFYYNDIIAVDEKGDIISNYDKRMIPFGRRANIEKEVIIGKDVPVRIKFRIIKRYEAFWSPSCIAIKKDFMLSFIQSLEGVMLAPGIFLASTIVPKDCSILIDNRKLTFYRVHSSTSHPNISNRDEFFRNREIFYKNSIYSLEKSYVTNKDSIDFVNIFLSLARLNYFIFSSNLNRKQLINDFISINKNKDILGLHEISVINILFLLALITPKKILREIFWFLSAMRDPVL